VVANPQDYEPLIACIIRELDLACRSCNLAAETVYVGGGTPTLLPPSLLARLLHACRNAASRQIAEFTVEANPETFGPHVARVLAEAGVNRLSLGAQSFDPTELRTLDRTHSPQHVQRAATLCRDYHLDNLNLDLIFAIPGQTLESWQASLAAAVNLGPDHISCYALSFEPGTRLYNQWRSGHLTRVDEDLEADMYETAIEFLSAEGYRHYEISNFARPGKECRHNLTYWRNEPYLGVGPSAAGYVDGLRYKNLSDLTAYSAAVNAGRLPRQEQERLDPDRQARETAMLALRLTDGLSRADFARRFDRDPEEFFADAVRKNAADGLLEVTDDAIRLTRRGLLLADMVIRDFL
jgi:oxygen-independent coproporphyrinogen-3 oxidase